MTDRSKELLKRIQKREARIAVIGIGYVGLPLSMAFADAGFEVTGIDVDAKRVRKLQKGESDIPDVPSATLKKHLRTGRFRATTSFETLRNVDAVSICVPTPLRKTRDPDISYIVAATGEVVKHIRAGQLIVLESTTYPGTTREIVVPRLEKAGFKVGTDIFVAFSPERVDPGNKHYGIRNTPKVVGGITKDCTNLAAALYGAAIDRVVQVSSADSAELVKLLENTFRAVNIGLINEISLVCNKLGIDVWEVINAASSKPFGFMPFYPGPGLGGHCIPIDPHYLAWKLRTMDYRVRFIELADDVNRAMPEHVVVRVSNSLNQMGKTLKGSKVLILGMAYKKGVGDLRESPSLDIAKMFRDKGASVSFHDPFIQQEISLEGWKLPSVPTLSSKTLKGFDAVVISTDHPQVDYSLVVKSSRMVFDTRNATRGLEGAGGHVEKL